jgi:hypothetical protein
MITLLKNNITPDQQLLLDKANEMLSLSRENSQQAYYQLEQAKTEFVNSVLQFGN